MELYSGNKLIDTVFELIGEDENSMTYSLGWVMLKCPAFFTVLLGELLHGYKISENTKIYLQKHHRDKGFTDIEIVDENELHVIIEAKKGFNVPSESQLLKYADRLKKNGAKKKLLVVLAEDDRNNSWLSMNVKSLISGVEVCCMSWQNVRNLCRHNICKETSTNSQKRLLKQFDEYLGKVSKMQDTHSNSVYVVSLGKKIFFEGSITKSGQPISFIDVVEKHRRYFHPVGGGKGGWPINPPNYIAFRYHGRLQSIHHIKHYSQINDYSSAFPLKAKMPTQAPTYLYELGLAIKPPKEVRTNDREKKYPSITMSSRRKADIDLLLTSDSIAEAVKKTSDRHN